MQPYVFAGLKVLDVATVIAGPAAAMMLADFGAEVIKIEEPGAGDMLRMLSTIPTTPPDAPSNYLLQMDGRNKRSLTLNLKTPEGQAVLRKLVAECDVFITNQPHSVRRSLRLNYEDLRPLNPRMIYASLTAYGEEGPERERKGFDQLAYWARSGLMDLMRQPGTSPSQGLPGMGDHPTAVSIYAGIVTALLQREKTGAGAQVTTSLLANGLWSAACIVQGAMAGADMPKYREINLAHTMIMRPYQASDGRWLQFNMVRSEELLALTFAGLDALHLLADERFETAELMMANRKTLGDLIQDLVGQKTSDEWLARFAELGVPVNRVARVEEAAMDPQVLLNGMAEPAGDTLGMPLVVKHPIRVSSAPRVRPARAPELGEHSEEILREIGYGAEQIAAMRERGAI